MHILIADDEKRMRDLLQVYLTREGYTVTEAADGEEALALINTRSFDLFILDVMMPGIDGWSLCRRIREKQNTPIILLTARGDESDRLLGFELGVDDYVVKPFSPRELVARVKAMLRRANQSETTNNRELTYGGLSINPVAREVKINGLSVDLTPKEFDLLLHLAQNPGRAFSREELLSRVWGYDFYGDLRTVDTHIKNLREKITRKGGAKNHIQTVWGYGYKFEVDPHD